MIFGRTAQSWRLGRWQFVQLTVLSFTRTKFEDSELETLKKFVLSDEYRSMKDETPYFRAAWLMEHAGSSHQEVTWELLQATWEAHKPQERYLRYAQAVLDRLPDDIQAASGAEKIKMRLLQGELLRRVEKFNEAIEMLRTLTGELDPESVAIVKYEIQLSEQSDSRPHRACEAFKQADKRC